MKRLFLVHIVIGLILALVGSVFYVDAQFVQTEQENDSEYCQNSTICGTASPEFVMMLDFVREMITSIKTIGTEGEYLGQYVSPNRFQGHVFDPPKKTVVGKLVKNVEQKLKFGMALTSIFANPVNFVGFKDVVGGTILVSKNKVFLRDNALIEEMESLLTDKKYELGMGGGRYEKVNDANLQIMQNIIEKYIDAGLLLSWSNITPGVTYNNIAFTLTRVLSSMKTFIYFDTIDQFSDIRRGYEHGISIGFSDDIGQKLKDEYNCARGLLDVCNVNKTTWKKLWEDFTTKLTSSPYNNKDVFMDAVDRLRQLFSSDKDQEYEDRKYEDRKYELLRSTYGQTERKKGILRNVVDISYETGYLGEVGTAFVQNWKPVKKPSEKVTNIVSKKEGVVPQILDERLYGDALYKNILLSSVSDVFVRQLVDYQLVSSAEIKSITPAFDIIGGQISTIKTNILGDKNTDNTLIKNLGEACDAQCGRPGLCR